MSGKMLRLIGVVSMLVQISWQQQDPVNDFCRRWGHQTAVIDDNLWIDGGQVNWTPFSTTSQNISNTWLLYQNFSAVTPLGVPPLTATSFKNATIPDVTGGVLWEDNVNKRFFLFGGEYLNTGTSPNPVNIWAFDAINNYWQNSGSPPVSAQISGVSYAGHVAVPEVGQGFALGGWMNNLTTPNWSGGPVASSALLKYDMTSNLWTNETGPDSTPRAEGTLVYIPASDHGLLVYFGGVEAPYYNSTTVAANMTDIYIYDVTSSKWYSQTAAGDIPPNRRRFCGGAAWAEDHSSYNIYIYGGLGFGDNATGFDDLWILSLPTFTWIKWYSGNNSAAYHHSLTCNVVNNAQMLVIGGTFPVGQSCDSANTYGTHNVDMGKVSGNKWEIYNPNITAYNVPSEIIAVVGGAASGGATATAPAGGFQSSDLNVYFKESITAARSPTRSIPVSTSTGTGKSSSSELSPGAIAGIAVGGAVILIALLLAGCCLVRRHRRRNNPQQQKGQQAPLGYPAPDYSAVPQSPYTPGGSPYHPPVQQHYQLPAPVPVELQGNNYHVDPTKHSGIHQLPAEPMFGQGSPHSSPYSQHISPSIHSPHSHHSHHSSPMNTYFSPTTESQSGTLVNPGSATSPTPTYSSLGRQGRKPVPQNQTYYSP